MARSLSAMLRQLQQWGITGVTRSGKRETRVSGLTDDSRAVRPGWLFAAHRGEHTDGHRFVVQAIERGATVILHRLPASRLNIPPGVVSLQAQDVPAALSALSRSFYRDPAAALTVVGVTGTNGKTTTVWLLCQLLESRGIPCGFVTTAARKITARIEPTTVHQTTPPSYEIHRLLREMVDAGRRVALVEATSHGLSARTARLRDVRFDAGILTNLTHEHLEFHGTPERYRSDKANLFRSLARPVPGTPGGEVDHPIRPFAVLNRDDPSFSYFAEQLRLADERHSVRVLSYSADCAESKKQSVSGGAADLSVLSCLPELTGTRLRILRTIGSGSGARRGQEQAETYLPLPGRFNVQNALAALAAALELTSDSLDDLCALLPALHGVPGRMEPIEQGQPYRVIVDFAHTPDAFEKLFSFLRPLADGRILTVFGSAGERDREKRAIQGRIAARWCDLVILTDEDPRSEDPVSILKEIAAGCGRVQPLLIPDRREAIARAFDLARPGDVVLLLGKGHERSIIYASGAREWNEAEVARALLAERGYGR